jgi:hypothetical protein
MDLGGSFKWTSEWSHSTFSNGNTVCPIQVEQTQRILRAVVDISVSTNTRHRKQVELRPNHSAGNRQRIIKTRIAVNDQRQRLSNRADRSGSRRELRVMKGWPTDH